MRRTALACTGLLIISTFTLTSCAESVRTAASDESPSTSAAPVETESASPTPTPSPSETNEWGDPNPPTYVEDEVENILMYWPEAASHDGEVMWGFIEDVCESDMNNGAGYNFLAEEDGFAVSTFDRRVSGMADFGNEPYAVPKIMAYHFCPQRQKAVYAVQKFHEANK